MAHSVALVEPWWTKEATDAQAAVLDDGTSCSTYYSGPCGGCGQCLLAQLLYYRQTGYTLPRIRAAEHGLGWWPLIQAIWWPVVDVEEFDGGGEAHSFNPGAPEIWHDVRCLATRRDMIDARARSLADGVVAAMARMADDPDFLRTQQLSARSNPMGDLDA